MTKTKGKRNSARRSHGRPARGSEVGYCRPPKAHQFRPGKSGNPKGRPKGAKNEVTILRNILNRQIDSHQGGRVRKISVLEGILAAIYRGRAQGQSEVSHLPA